MTRARHVTAGDVLTLAELRELHRALGARRRARPARVGGYRRTPLPATRCAVVLTLILRCSDRLPPARPFVLIHEALWLLFAQPAVNTWVGTWLVALRSHAILRLTVSTPFITHTADRERSRPRAPRRFQCRVAPSCRPPSDVSGCTALAPRSSPALARWRAARCEAVLFAIFAAAGAWHLYLLLWLTPLVTWAQLVGRLREVAEHGAVTNDDPLRTTRTTAAGWLARALVAPYWVNYHLEHHLMVFVPCWKLARAQRARTRFTRAVELAAG